MWYTKFNISWIDDRQIESIIMFHPIIFSEIYHERFVNNIYFDTESFRTYFDNIHGS